MQNDQKIQRTLYSILLAFTFGFLAWNAFTVGIEYFDGIDYIFSGQGLFGAPWGVKNPKNLQQILFTGAVWRASTALGHRPGLVLFHTLYFGVHAFVPVVVAGFLRKHLPALPILAMICVGAWSRIFVHYSPFLLPDLTSALWIALWFLVEIEVPEGGRWKTWLRIFVLTGTAMNRPLTLVIPFVAIAWESWAKPERIWPYFLAALGFLLCFGLVFCGFFFLVSRQVAWGSLVDGLGYLSKFGNSVRLTPGQPAYAYVPYLQKNLSWPGTALLLTGAGILVKQRARLPRSFQGLAMGSLAYIFVLMGIGERTARYLTPTLPAWVMLECLALAFLEEKRRWLGFLGCIILFESVGPEMAHFLDPVYRVNHFEQTAHRIAAWSESNYVIELPYFAAFHPKDSVFDANDNYFYLYHWNAENLYLFTNLTAVVQPSATFQHREYPIPDELEKFAPQGVTVLLPSPEYVTTSNAQDFIYPIFAVRWFDNALARSRRCSPLVREICVEIFPAFPGIKL